MEGALALPRRVLALRRLIRQLKADLVHGYGHAGVVARLAAGRIPTVSTLPDPSPDPGGWRARLRALIEEKAAARCARLLAPSEAVRRYYAERWGVQAEVLPSFLDVPMFRERLGSTPREQARMRLGVAPDDVALLYVGRGDPEEGLAVLLEAFRLARVEHQSLRLFLTGQESAIALAAGTAAIAAGYLSVLLWLEGEAGLALLSFALVGSLLGFLAHNYPPARIFMGDSGSLFLGLFLAGLSLSPAPGLSRSLFAVVAVPALILAIPILDTTLVTVGRVLEGRPIAQGGRDHTSHRLVALGVSEERAVWVLWSLAFLGGAVALLLRSAERPTAYLLGGVLLTLLVLVGGYLLSVRFRAMSEQEADSVPLYRVLLTLHERFPVLPFALDALLVGLAYYGAYLVRWDPAELGAQLSYLRASALIVVVSKLLAFVLGGIYGPRWHHFSVDDGVHVARASLLGTLIATAALMLVDRVGLSRGVLVMDFLLCTTLIMGSRLVFRFLEGATRRWSLEGTPVVVLGALDEAELALRPAPPRAEPAAQAGRGG